jgi:hypothetical protein
VLIHSSVVRLRATNHESMGCTAAENDQQDALCLVDEFMELANEILEDEPNAPTLPRALQCTGME